MTAQEMRQLFAYNAWATNKFFDTLGPMAHDQLIKEMHTSHSSIFNTLTHLVGAEKIWYSRWTGGAVEPFLKAESVPSLAALKELWTKVGFDIAKFIASVTDKKLLELFEMKTSKGEVFAQIYWQAMLHVIDHSTYHRGQIVAMLRQMDVVPPSTGMIGFFRETAKLGTSKG